MYGVILPHDNDPRLAAPRSRSEPPHTASSAAAAFPIAVPGDTALLSPPDAAAASAGGSAATEPPPSPAAYRSVALFGGRGVFEPRLSGPDPSAAAAATGEEAPPVGSPPRQATLPPLAEAVLPQELPAAVANPPAIVMEYVSGKSLG